MNRLETTYVWTFCNSVSFLPILSIQDDIGPAVDTGPCVDPITGDLGAGAAEADSALNMGGTNVGLGASMSDMPAAKLADLGL